MNIVDKIVKERTSKNYNTFHIFGNTKDLFKNDKGMYVPITGLCNDVAKALGGEASNYYYLIFHPRMGWIQKPESDRTKFESCLKTHSGDDLERQKNDLGIGDLGIGGDKVFPDNPIQALVNVQKWMDVATMNSMSKKKAASGPKILSETLIIVIPEAELLISSEGWRSNKSGANAVTNSIIHNFALNDFITEGELPHTVILISSDDASESHPALSQDSNGICQVRADIPDSEERSAYFDKVISEKKLKAKKGDISMLARDSSGCTIRMLRQFVNDCKSGTDLQNEVLAFRKHKVSALGGGIIDIDTPVHGREVVGGLDYVFKAMEECVYPFLREQNPLTPSGAIFMGPPGTGKSITAEAIAKECGLPFITLRLENAFNWFVGATEQNINRVLSIIKAVSPCVVWLDEVDQIGMQRGAYQGDSGVSARVLKRFLEFLGDDQNHGKVFFIAASNEVKLIDPAIKRSGRLGDLKIPFVPRQDSSKGPASIFRALLNKYAPVINNLDITVDVDCEAIGEKAQHLLGSDTELLVKNSLRVASQEKDKKLTNEIVIDLIPHIPASVSAKDKNRYIKEAMLNCSVSTYLPTDLRDLQHRMQEIAQEEQED